MDRGKGLATRRARRLVRLAVLALAAITLPGASRGATSSVWYSYDQVGRVTSAAYDTGACTTYAYDANGNRLSQTTTSGAPPTSPVWGSGTWGCFKWTTP